MQRRIAVVVGTLPSPLAAEGAIADDGLPTDRAGRTTSDDRP